MNERFMIEKVFHRIGNEDVEFWLVQNPGEGWQATARNWIGVTSAELGGSVSNSRSEALDQAVKKYQKFMEEQKSIKN